MRGIGTVTLLFTDVVGSTRLLDTLGDEAAEAVRRRHFGLLREALVRCRGREVKNLGDGLMAVFDSAVDAVACAIRMQRDVADDVDGGLEVRVGLHAGEPVREGDDYFGIPVVIARRLCDDAAGGQILASGIVRALAESRGTVEFAPLGARELKGVGKPVEVAEVDWRSATDTSDAGPDGGPAGIRVLIADDHPVFRDGLASLLEPVHHIEVVGLATNGREAVKAALALEADVVVMDLQMPDQNGIEATRELLAQRPATGVLMLTMFEEDDSVFAAMRAGARGYVLKGAEQAKIVQAIEAIAAGRRSSEPGSRRR